LNRPKVLAITERHAEICATQSLLNEAGIQALTATNMNAVRAIIKSTRLRGIIICKDSWSPEEHDNFAADLWMLNPQVAAILRCCGCTECDELTLSAGTLRNTIPLAKFIDVIASKMSFSVL
jgi:hypothetical protein